MMRLFRALRQRTAPEPRTVPFNELLSPHGDVVDALTVHIERLIVAQAPVWTEPVGSTSQALVVSVSDAARTIAAHLTHVTEEFAGA